jgi:hypothetical protein
MYVASDTASPWPEAQSLVVSRNVTASVAIETTVNVPQATALHVTIIRSSVSYLAPSPPPALVKPITLVLATIVHVEQDALGDAVCPTAVKPSWIPVAAKVTL